MTIGEASSARFSVLWFSFSLLSRGSFCRVLAVQNFRFCTPVLPLGPKRVRFFVFVPVCSLEKASRRPICALGVPRQTGRRRRAWTRRKGHVSDLRKSARPFQEACWIGDGALRSGAKAKRLHELRPFSFRCGTEAKKSHSGYLAASLVGLRPGVARRWAVCRHARCDAGRPAAGRGGMTTVCGRLRRWGSASGRPSDQAGRTAGWSDRSGSRPVEWSHRPAGQAIELRDRSCSGSPFIHARRKFGRNPVREACPTLLPGYPSCTLRSSAPPGGRLGGTRPRR